jgi:hypothetical protein
MSGAEHDTPIGLPGSGGQGEKYPGNAHGFPHWMSASGGSVGQALLPASPPGALSTLAELSLPWVPESCCIATASPRPPSVSTEAVAPPHAPHAIGATSITRIMERTLSIMSAR